MAGVLSVCSAAPLAEVWSSISSDKQGPARSSRKDKCMLTRAVNLEQFVVLRWCTRPSNVELTDELEDRCPRLTTSCLGSFLLLPSIMFHHTKGSSLHNLHPASQGILPHIKRSFYNAYTIMHSFKIHLDEETVLLVKPEDCGYEYDREDLIRTTSWKTSEPHWSVSCTCMKCARSTCPCRMAGFKCGHFCQCKKKPPTVCQNPITWLHYYVLRGGHLTYSKLSSVIIAWFVKSGNLHMTIDLTKYNQLQNSQHWFHWLPCHGKPIYRHQN